MYLAQRESRNVYRLVYEINDETAWILALVHTARQRPPVRG